MTYDNREPVPCNEERDGIIDHVWPDAWKPYEENDPMDRIVQCDNCGWTRAELADRLSCMNSVDFGATKSDDVDMTNQPAADRSPGTLCILRDGSIVRPATQDETDRSIRASRGGKFDGTISVPDVAEPCFVDGGISTWGES